MGYAKGKKMIPIDNTVIEEILPKKRKVFNALILFAVSMGMVGSIIGLISFYFLVPFLILLLILIPGYKSLIETVVISSKGLKYITIFKKIDCDWNDILKMEVETSGQTGSIWYHDGQEDSKTGSPYIEQCENHPDKNAVRQCDGCDKPFCSECLRKNRLGFYYCQQCFPALFKNTPVPDIRKNYTIHTSKGTFSLKENSAWGWNALTLKNAYDKIISRAPNAEIIQTEVVGSIPKNRVENTYGVVVTFLLIYGLLIWGLEGGEWGWALLLSFFLLFILIPGVNSLLETVVISSKGIKYSEDFRKIECDWKDLLQIDVETHKQRSEQTGLVISSKINYIINTSKGTFSLKESSAWGWNASNLKNAYKKIICHVPNVVIIHKEVVTTVSEGK
jgi:hypothetical protein